MYECSPEKIKLVEEMGVHFEKKHDFSPLAARIFSIMVVSPNDGHTFEEIVEITKASKSTVSTHLNLLLQLKTVEYFTISGDRKRYFRASKNYLRVTLEEYLLHVTEEIQMLEKISSFNEKNNKQKFEKNKNFDVIFKNYLKNQKINLEEMIEKMSKLNEQK